MGDLTKNDIEVCDLEINNDGDGISAYLETFFDVDKKFGTTVNDDENSWVNFYAEYFPESGELKCTYFVDRANGSDEHEYVPSANEKSLIISMLEEECQKESGYSISEFLNSYTEESSLSLS